MNKLKLVFLVVILVFIGILTSLFNKDIYDSNFSYQSDSNFNYNFKLDSDVDINILNPDIYFIDYNLDLIDAEHVVLDLINNSKSKIYCAIYSLSSKPISKALISKKKEGLDIFIITDLKQSSNKSSQITYLKSNNIFITTNVDPNKYMHNKFCVFDNNIILIGSTNFTFNSLHKNNNNFMVFRDENLALFFEDYILNFNKERSENNLRGSIHNSHFAFYFCDKFNCADKVLNLFKDFNKSIKCMQYSLTYFPLYLELESKKINDSNLDISFILESSQISKYSLYDKIKQINSNIIIKDENPYLMHNKFCIFDNSILLTGSANLSNNGLNNNYETIVVIKDPEVINKFNIYFNNYWNLWN